MKNLQLLPDSVFEYVFSTSLSASETLPSELSVSVEEDSVDSVSHSCGPYLFFILYRCDIEYSKKRCGLFDIIDTENYIKNKTIGSKIQLLRRLLRLSCIALIFNRTRQ